MKVEYNNSTYLYTAIFVVLAILLQWLGAYQFYYVEQNQLFQYAWTYVGGRLGQVGGLAVVVSEFCVQFYAVPYLGALITAAWLTLVGALTHLLLLRFRPATRWWTLSILPVITLMLMHFDYNYQTSGTVAFALMLAALNLTFLLRSVAVRLAAHTFATIALFVLAGPVFALYAVIATVCELCFCNDGKHFYALLLPLLALLTGILSVHQLWTCEYRHTFLPDGYYHDVMQPRMVIYFAWIAILVIVISLRLLPEWNRGWKRDIAIYGVQVALYIIICTQGIRRYGDIASYEIKKFDYFSRTEQWDRILDCATPKINNYRYLNYFNLALAGKGQLGSHLFTLDQHGVQGLLPVWDGTAPSALLAGDIYFAVNHIAKAQEMAFEANISAMCGGNPRAVKRLVQTNIVFGFYAVAEKYIRLLESTFAYRSWAKSQRRFLYNDAAVEADPLLGDKRRSLPADDHLALTRGLEADFLDIANANPSNSNAMEFAGALLLLDKNMSAMQELLKLYGTPALTTLPRSFQEAALMIYEQQPDMWTHFRLPTDRVGVFNTFRREVIANRSAGDALPAMLESSFGDTYYYYYLYKKLPQPTQ
ncbi:MAG: DUF6057 family protein [Tannerella sp.]|jgi:hypothetical protein|nr:DUF6057 family protein [Tannerella sp.]